jgi:hypothetical protein
MAYTYAVRGWLELSWPDQEFEGIDETAEEHAAKVQRVREATTSTLQSAQLLDSATPDMDRYRVGWAWPQGTLDGSEYVLYGADVEEPPVVLKLIREVLAIDPYADGYFSVEGEDGEQYRQWIIKGGKIYTRRALFPNFDEEGTPEGYTLVPGAS